MGLSVIRNILAKLNLSRRLHLSDKHTLLALTKHDAGPRRLNAGNVEAVCEEVLKRYSVGDAVVHICIDRAGVPRYLIDEPVLEGEAVTLYRKILDLVQTLQISFNSIDDVRRTVRRLAMEISLDARAVEKYLDSIVYYVSRDAFGFGVLDVPLKDERVEDIEVSDWRKPVTVVHRDFLGFDGLVTNISFTDPEDVRGIIERLAFMAGKAISLSKPEVHASIAEGIRISATLGEPVSLSPTLDIRKLLEVPIDIVTLINAGTVNPPELASLIWLVNESKLFYSIIGGSGTGKTTLLNAFIQLSNPRWKVVIVQDVAEIKLPERPRVIQFFGESSEELFNRCVTALRYRPDMLIVGEVRGREIAALVRAVASGSGSATTFHASTTEEFEMVLRSLLPKDLYTMLSLNTALLVFVSKTRSGAAVRRAVSAVYERVGTQWREIELNPEAVYSSAILKRIGKRLDISDVEAELEYRTKLLKSTEAGYINVERMLKKFYRA